MLISIVIPVYDSPVLEELTDSIGEVFRGRPEHDYEIVFVDDRSPDPGIWPTLERLARERDEVRAVQLTRNFGQQAATICGLREARGDVVVTMDDDLQHAPQDILLLLAHADRDIVIGQLTLKRHGLIKRLTSRIKGIFDQIIIGKPRGIHLSSFRLLGRTVVDGVLSIRTPNPFLPALMFHVSKDVVGVAVTHGARRGGRSGYTLRKLFRVFSNLLINNSSLVLRSVGCVGISFALISFFFAAVAVYRKLAHGVAVQGWASLFAALLLIGGLLLVSLGVVGEYLIRIIESSEGRPTYLVRRRLGFGPPPDEGQR